MAIHRRSIPELATSVFSMLSSSASSLSTHLTDLVPGLPGHSAPSEVPAEYFESYTDEVMAWEDRHAECTELCKVRTIEGARSGLEALCSLDGLQSTRELAFRDQRRGRADSSVACAQCIDTTWPEDMFENSAMAEYDRIVQLCEAPQAIQQ